MGKVLIILSLIFLLCLTNSSEGLAMKDILTANSKAAKQDIASAERTLREYLLERSLGKYEKCLEFLSEAFQDKFLKRFGHSFVDYYRNQNENLYRDFKILSVKKLDRGFALITVAVDFEGPGYKSKAFETYHMIQERGVWKIDDWDIQYSKDIQHRK
jgi:hypothetical protein